MRCGLLNGGFANSCWRKILFARALVTREASSVIDTIIDVLVWIFCLHSFQKREGYLLSAGQLIDRDAMLELLVRASVLCSTLCELVA